jgi:hypothetical protein
MTGNIENDTENLIAEVIDGAADIRDPLDGLVEQVRADPGAAFAPEVLERLAALKNEDRAAFEVLRSNLKKFGCRVAALDEAIGEQSGEEGRRGPSQADILIELGPNDTFLVVRFLGDDDPEPAT